VVFSRTVRRTRDPGRRFLRSPLSVCNILHFDFDLRVYEYTPVRGTGGRGAQPRARGGPGLRRDPGAGWVPRRATAGNPRGPTHPPRVRPWPATGRHATVRLPVRRWGWCTCDKEAS